MKKLHDYYFKKAKKENHLARSIYKLEEIDKKYKLIKKAMSLIDLGSAPGSWIEYASSKIGTKGRILGIDLKEVKKSFPNNVKIIQGNIFDFKAFEKAIEENKNLTNTFDIIISDMAPNTSGQKDIDAYKSYELCVQALKIAEKYLRINGNFLIKIFMGEDFKNFLDAIKSSFEKYKVYKPKSSRNESFETYIIAWGRKKNINIPLI